MVRTKNVPKTNVIKYYNKRKGTLEEGRRKNNNLYAYVFRRIKKRYVDNKSNGKKQRVEKRRYRYALSRVALYQKLK